MSILFNDVKYAYRQLRKNPGFTAVAVLSLALCIGANTAIFNVLSAVKLRLLPVKNPHELRSITWTGNLTPSTQWNMFDRENVFSYQTYQDFRNHTKGSTEIFAFLNKNEFHKKSVFANGRADAINVSVVSSNFFSGLGLSALIGQTITSYHDSPNVEPVTMISYTAWQRYFAGDPQVIGHTVTLNSHSFTIIGILPRDFKGLVPGERRDFYVPMSTLPLIEGSSGKDTSDWWVSIMARLTPDTDESMLRASLEMLFAGTAEHTPSSEPQKVFQIVLKDAGCGLMASNKNLIKSLHLLLGLAGIVLIVTCVNLAGLLLVRGIQRQHEFTVRAALGAGRYLLIRQLLIESVLVVLAGTGFGLVLAYWGKVTLTHLLLSPGTIIDLHSDGWVLAFTLALSIVTSLLAGLLPAFLSTRSSSITLLKDRSSLGIPSLKLSRTLVSVQIGLSLVLLIGAGLFARTLTNLYQVDAGFDTGNMLVFEVNASAAGSGEKREELYKQFATSLRSLPGVKAVGYSNFTLLSGNYNSRRYSLPDSSAMFSSKIIDVDQSFLKTMCIPLVMGRDFNTNDFENAQKVVIVNQSLVLSAFPGKNPIDKTICFSSDEEKYRIIGVCRDFRSYNIKKPSEPTILLPTGRGSSFKVRTTIDPQFLIPSVRKTLAAIDPAIPMSDIKTQAIQLDESVAQERCYASLATLLAFLAMLLSCIGLYGVIAYNVACRTGEIGIRLALGATPRNVAWPILRSALLVTATGVIIGVPVVLVAVQIIRNLLFDIEPYDPVTLVGAVVLLFVISILAAWIPTQRAAKINPMEALRYE